MVNERWYSLVQAAYVIAGVLFIFSLAGRIPERGEVIRHPSGCEFEIVDVDPRRIRRLRVRLPQPASTSSATMVPESG